MDALLIVGGLLLILAGLVWLVSRAFGVSLLWGWACLLPPLTLLFILRKWRAARQPIVLAALGFIPLVVGLALLGHHDPQRISDILSLKWLHAEQVEPAELAIKLNGKLNGQPFTPLQGELIDGVLTLREGHDFYARRELIIRLPASLHATEQIDVLPSDNGVLPEIELNWLLPEQDLPEARIIHNGYTLHLNLQPVAPNKLAGVLHLVLPPAFNTRLDGVVEVYRNNLRYVGGQVDRHVDSNDTLAYVLVDYLQRRFATEDVVLDPLPAVSFTQSNLTLPITAQVDGIEQALSVVVHKSLSRGWAVQGDKYPKRVAAVVVAPPSSMQRPETLQTSATAPRVDRREHFTLQRLLRSPSRYQNLTLRVTNLKGHMAKGKFIGIDGDGNVQLKQPVKGAGEASFSFDPDKIATIELLDP